MEVQGLVPDVELDQLLLDSSAVFPALFAAVDEGTSDQILWERFYDALCGFLGSGLTPRYTQAPTVFAHAVQLGVDGNELLGQCAALWDFASRLPLDAQLRAGAVPAVDPRHLEVVRLLGEGRPAVEVVAWMGCESVEARALLIEMIGDGILELAEGVELIGEDLEEELDAFSDPSALERGNFSTDTHNLESIDVGDLDGLILEAAASFDALVRQAPTDPAEPVATRVSEVPTPASESTPAPESTPPMATAPDAGLDEPSFGGDALQVADAAVAVDVPPDVAEVAVELVDAPDAAPSVSTMVDDALVPLAPDEVSTAPLLDHGEVVLKLRAVNELLSHLGEAVGGENGAQRLAQQGIDSASGRFLFLFHGVELQDGTLPAQLLTNLAKKPETEHRSLLSGALREFVESCLSVAADELEEEAFEEVFRAAAGVRKVLI